MDRKTERELLLYCLGLGTDEIRAGKLEQLSASDWDGVIQLSARHGVTPLLYKRLRTLSPGTTIPAGIVQRLREAYLHSSARSMSLYHEISKVLTVLQNDGIPVIVLKGAHLAEVVYGNTALRPMSDVDLLVKRADLSRVEEKLLEIGYAPDEKNSTQFAQDCSHYTYMLPEKDLLLEVHWDIQGLNSPFNINVSGLWERARPAMIAGVEALVLSPEDLLLYLCLHTSFRHLFDVGLMPFCDISETIRHYRGEIGWEQVQYRARQWGASNCVYLTLLLTKKLFGAAVPDEVLQGLEPNDFDTRFVAWAEGRIFSQVDNIVGPPSDNWGRLWASKRLLDKASVLLKTCFAPPQIMAEMYSVPPGSKRIYLYYPVRLKDLLRRHARRAWLLLRRDDETKAWVEREAGRVEKLAIVNQVLRHDDETKAWIEQDVRRVEQFAVVKWLTSA